MNVWHHLLSLGPWEDKSWWFWGIWGSPGTNQRRETCRWNSSDDSTFYTATLQPFTDLPHNLGAGIPLSAAPHPLKTMGWKPKYILGLSIFIFVYDEILASITFNFHIIRVDVYSICRFNMIEHDLTAHSKTSRPTQGPFPGHVAPMDACVLGQCRSATGGDLDWAIDQ